MTHRAEPPSGGAPEWIDLPCGLPERVPSARPPVVLMSPVPRRGRGERPRVIQIRAPRRPRPRGSI